MRAVVVLGSYLAASTLALGQPTPGTQHMIGAEPPVGVPTEKEVGDVIYAKFDYTATNGVRLLEEFETRELMREVLLSSGAFLTAKNNKRFVDFCSKEGAASGFQPGEVVCFRDANRDGRLEQLHIPGTRFGAFKMLKSPGPRYEESIDLDSTKGFRRELLYDGISGGVVRLGYREFIDSLARPAFQQELTYTLEATGSTEVAFRGARLRILSATNQQIQYEVLAGLRD